MQALGIRLVPIMFAAAFSVSAASQTVLESLLDDLSRYFGAAARLTVSVIAGIDAVQAAQLPAPERQAATEELRRISQEILDLREKQEPLVFDMGEYVTRVRAGALDPDQRVSAWRSILRGIGNVSPIVQTTLEVVKESRWLKAALSEDDRLTLQRVLMGRATLLNRLRALDPPSTPEEIDQLDSASRFYRELMKSLDALNAALLRGIDRLSSG
jgi:hypothetical protein